jgi:hypothetical protein
MKNLIQKNLFKIGDYCYNRALEHGFKQNYRREYWFFLAYAKVFNIKEYLR